MLTSAARYFQLQREIITSYGYPFEAHEVTTDDGYILTMHRIPHGIAGPSANRPAVYLQHGLLCSSADWVVSGPERGFAFILADAGYDVWLGNVRGNTHSRRHVSMSPDRRRFWDFSWHEIALYDLPAMIDYVIATTGQPRIQYAGHSQGTTTFFILMSLRPEYNDKIRSGHMLAPVAYMGNLRSPFVRAMAPFADQLDWIMWMLGAYEFMPNSEMLAMGGYFLCRDEAVFQEVCANVLFLIGGFNSNQLNRTMLPAILRNTPAGASVGQLVHYAHGVNSGRFRQFDHGLVGNLARYGSINPPEYPLENISAPIALHFSDNDWLAAVRDVDTLARRLRSMIGRFRVPDPLFNHLDYQWAIDAKSLLYDRVMNLMMRF